MKPETKEQKFDVRIRERALRNGTISKQDVQSYLKSIPDEASRGEEINIFVDEPANSDSSLTFSAATDA